MEVKDLIQDPLTEQEQKEKDLLERKEKYKATQRYLLSPAFRKLIEEFTIEWEEIFTKIKTELKTRKKTEALSSEVDKIVADIAYYKKIISKLDKTEWAKILKGEIEARITNAESNIYIKVAPEELFDLPVFTKLDMLKRKRNSYLTTDKLLHNISDWFFDDKEKGDNPNPYDEAN